MSFLFGGNTPSPAPLPASPNTAEAERQRQDAERAAIAERASAGRRSTIVAGRQIAADEQMESGLLAKARRGAAREMVG